MHYSPAVARTNMIDGQIKPFGVNDEVLLHAFNEVPREAFVPSEWAASAYAGEHIPMGQGRYLLDAALYARLLQAMALPVEARVLDIGCLYGYSSAVLSQLVREVVAVDSAPWSEKAKTILGSLKNANIAVETAELTAGVPGRAPYDVIVINGAVQNIPDALWRQLKPDGFIATFVRNASGPELAAGQAVILRKDTAPRVLFDALVPVLKGFEKAEGFVF